MSASRYYGAPGVYKEVVYAPQVQPQKTGVPAFLGLTNLGLNNSSLNNSSLNKSADTDVLKNLRGWGEFVQEFGPPVEGAYLGYAVRGFFANGGTSCYVLPLAEISESAIEAGLTQLVDADEIDLVCVPDIATIPSEVVKLQDIVIAHCAKLGNRFAILDSHPGANADSNVVGSQRNALQGRESHAALYYPWVSIRKDSQSSECVLVPPSGVVAGVYARTDAESGVYKAPANELVEDVVDTATNISDSEQAALNPQGYAEINCLRAFPGRGIRIWGAGTLSTDPNWMSVNIRRLFITVGRWIERNMTAMVFEPNDARLWARITRELTAYLSDLYLQGALKGAAPAEAFYVKCDAELNPQEVRDLGMVMTDIGLAPIVPAKFIVVRIIQTDAGVILSSPPSTVPQQPLALRATRTTAPASDIRISYIEYNPEGKDLSNEYVQIRNLSSQAIQLGNWTLRDIAGHVFRFPQFTLKPFAAVRVWTKRGINTDTDLYWGRAMAIWNNIGDEGMLKDNTGNIVHVYRYVA
jgi:phage tail sheath protein FI